MTAARRLQIWRGRLLIRPGFALFDGHSPRPASHRMFLIRVVVNPAAVPFHYGGKLMPPPQSAFIIPSNFALRPPTDRSDAFVWLIDPSTALGRCIPADAAQPHFLPQLDIERGVAAALQAFETRDLDPVIAHACEVFGFDGSTDQALQRIAAEPRITWLLNAMDGEPDLLKLSAWAKKMQMSYAHLSRLFVQHVGMSYSAYTRQIRLYRAVAALDHSKSLTDSAHWTGFSDLSHLSRTARLLLGVRLVELISGVRIRSARLPHGSPAASASPRHLPPRPPGATANG